MQPRRARRIDANQPEIVAALQCIPGVSVLVVNGTFDVLVGANGRNVMLEIKDGSKPPSARRLTRSEQLLHDRWTGDIRIVNDVDEAIAVAMEMLR